MSKVEIEIPDDKWIHVSSGIVPKDKQLCIVIHKRGKRVPQIYQYRKADCLSKESDYFLDVNAKWHIDSFGLLGSIVPLYFWDSIDYWRPLDLPKDANERILDDIEKWFEKEVIK